MNNFIIKYGDISIKTYNLKYNNNSLVATETDNSDVDEISSKRYKEFEFTSYINSIYSAVINNIPIKEYKKPNIFVNYGDYLVVVENDYKTVKRVFDLKNIELPENTKKQINEIEETLNKNNKNITTNKYLPFIYDITDKKVAPLVMDNEKDDLELLFKEVSESINSRRYLRDSRAPFYIGNYDVIFTLILTTLLIDNISSFNDLYDKHPILSVASLFLVLNRVLEDIGKKNIKICVEENFNRYLDLCCKIENGDLDAIKLCTEELVRTGNNNDMSDSDFYLSIFRDLTILECYKDKSFSTIKIALLSLGCEYIEYRSNCSKNDMIEEIFMKKLRDIESKIDLTNKEVCDKDDTMDFIATNCDFDDDNRLRLIPVVQCKDDFTKVYSL